MINEIRELRKLHEENERRYLDSKRRLDSVVRYCDHQWKHSTAYVTVPRRVVDFNAPQVQGIHLHYATRTENVREQQHQRQCTVCGHLETTTEVREEIKQVPKWD